MSDARRHPVAAHEGHQVVAPEAKELAEAPPQPLVAGHGVIPTPAIPSASERAYGSAAFEQPGGDRTKVNDAAESIDDMSSQDALTLQRQMAQKAELEAMIERAATAEDETKRALSGNLKE